MIKQSDLGFSFSSDSNEWYTPKEVCSFAEYLMGTVDFDLCGLSPHWYSYTKAWGNESDGLSTFLALDSLQGCNVFINPPYGVIPSQLLLKDPSTYSDAILPNGIIKAEWGLMVDLPQKYHNRCFVRGSDTTQCKRYLGDGIWEPANPENLLTQGYTELWVDKYGRFLAKDGEGYSLIKGRLHSAHTFADWVFSLWEAGKINQAFILIPSATDTTGFTSLQMRHKLYMTTPNRLSFMVKSSNGEMKPCTGNTKGSAFFWLPPKTQYKDPAYNNKVDRRMYSDTVVDALNRVNDLGGNLKVKLSHIIF